MCVTSGAIARGGASGMQAYSLQSWLAAANCEGRQDIANWGRVVEILHKAFRDVRLPTEFTWYTVVLITKGNREFRGIGLVEVL